MRTFASATIFNPVAKTVSTATISALAATPLSPAATPTAQ